MGVNDFADIWWDYEIPSGSDWHAEIRSKFEAADAFFVLGSDAYIASNYVRTHEWPVIERRVEERAARLFWASFDRPVESYGPPVALSRYQAALGRSAPLSEADTAKKKADFLTQVAEEIADFLVDAETSRSIFVKPTHQPTPREVEAAYLEALKNQCARLANRDRFLPMHQLYVHLKADERTSEELKASEQLIKQKIQLDFANESVETAQKSADEIISERLRQVSEVEQLPSEASVRFVSPRVAIDSLEEIFWRNRFLVVRGAPGSGKTVLCWKIAEAMAGAWREEFETRPYKTVLGIQASPLRYTRSMDFGIARLPIYIPIRDYAKACRERNIGFPLADFIGGHFTDEDSTYASQFNRFLLDRVRDGRTVLLLDGLDEVPAKDRHRIVEAIQIFLRTYINPTLTGSDGDPGDIGGNQIVITSRLSGYELAPMTEDVFRHFIIRPFDEEAVKKYCRNWAKMVYQPHTAEYGKMQDSLERVIITDSSPTVQELARNPLLLQVLCELAAPVQLPENSTDLLHLKELPRIRAEIYSQAIAVMANRWTLAYESVAEKNEHVKRLLEPGKIEELLSFVALEMHKQEVLTRATYDQLKTWLELALGRLERKSTLLMEPTDVSRTTTAFLELIRTHVGVISESAPGVFQFHHLTFQEYLAGIARCRTHNGWDWESAERLGRQMASIDGGLLDQRWREPRLLSFGYLSAVAKLDQKAPSPDAVLSALRTAWRHADSDATPEEAALLLSSLLLEVPDDVMQDLLEQVIRDLGFCYKTWYEAALPEENLWLFTLAFTRLRRRLTTRLMLNGATPFDAVAAKVIEITPELSAPLARICVDRGWLTPPILTVFATARMHDQRAWDWPLHQGLRRAVLECDDMEPKAVEKLELPDSSSKMQDRNNYDRAFDAWREQRQADKERVMRPELPARTRIGEMLDPVATEVGARQPDLLRRIIALCGGFADYQCARWTCEYHDLVDFLQKPDSVRDGYIRHAPELFLPRWGTEDVVYNIAVYLDTGQGKRRAYIAKTPEFTPKRLSHDPTPSMLRVLEASLGMPDGPQTDITRLLQDLAAAKAEPEVAAEAWIALMATGQAPPLPEHSAIAERVRWHCARIVDALRDPVVRFAHQSKQEGDKQDTLWSVLNRWLPALPAREAAETFRLVMRCLTEAVGAPVKPGLVWGGETESPVKLMLWGEEWAYVLAGRNDDAVYSLAVALDTLKFGSEPIQVFRECEAIVTSSNFRFVAGAAGGVQAPTGHESNDQALDYFFTMLRLIGEAAGNFKSGKSDFRAAMFNAMTANLFTRPESPPLMLMLLAEYFDALREDNFSLTPEAFKKMVDAFAGAGGREYRPPLEWNLADALNGSTSPRRSMIGSGMDIAMRLCRSDEISASDAWKALSIFMAAKVVCESDEATESQLDLWLRLESDVQGESARLAETLDHLLTRAGSHGLALSETAAHVIETLAHLDSKSSRDALRCIVPLLDHHAPTEIPRLRTWVAGNWHPKIGEKIATLLSRHAALLLAEHSRVIEPAWIEPVADLAHSGDDRSRARASLALGGPFTNFTRGVRRQRASALGRDSIEQVAARYLSACIKGGADRTLTYWFHDLHFDFHDAARGLVNSIHPIDKTLTGLSYLFGFGTWSEEALEDFAIWLKDDPIRWNDAFIIGYGYLAYQQPERIPAALHGIMRERIESRKVNACLLPENESYGIVIEASLKAIAGRGEALHDTASSILSARCECLRTGIPIGSLSLVETCSAMAESNLQWMDTYPEDCWPDVEKNLDNDQLFDLIFNWLAKELEGWSKRRSNGIRPTEPHDAYRGSVRNALLSILCVMTELNRDRFVILSNELEKRGQRLSGLLADAAVHGKRRSRMAAITLLSRLPNLDANVVAGVVQAALGDDEAVRKLAQMLIPHFREFNVTDEFIDSALAKLKNNEPASIVLAYANLLMILLNANQVKTAGRRREILNAFRNAANDTQNIRMLSHLAGSGATTSPRTVVNDGRLDKELLALIAKSYANFFGNS